MTITRRIVLLYRKVALAVVIFSISCLSNCLAQHRLQESFDNGKVTIDGLQPMPNVQNVEVKELFNKNVDASALSNLSDQDLVNQGARELNNSEMGDFLVKSEEVKIDAIQEHKFHEKNGLLESSQKIEANPLKETGGDNYTVTEHMTKVRVDKTCLEGVDFEVDIIRQLILESSLVNTLAGLQDGTILINQNEVNQEWNQAASWAGIKDRAFMGYVTSYKRKAERSSMIWLQLRNLIASKQNINPELIGDIEQIFSVTYKDYALIQGVPALMLRSLNYKFNDLRKTHQIKGEYWQVVNEESEKLVESENCYQTNRQCLDSGDKLFHGVFTINRPCWKEQITYRCKLEPIEGCKYLIDQGCHLDNSICVKKHGNICLQWRRNYQCFVEQKEIGSSLKNNEIFCLGGECHSPVIEENLDIHNVGYLAALNEMRKDMQGDPIYVFKGEDNRCNKFMVGFLNCCQSMKGWGKDVGLGKCKETEKALAIKKEKGLCHEIGTYCEEKDPVFKKCIRKKTSYCCFGSKLARVFQQQGKAQLGIGFGSPEEPNCRGFTVEELQRIDFSKFNLEELFADLIASAKTKINKAFPSTITNQMPLKQNNNYSNDY